MASRWEGCRLDALPRFADDPFPLPSFAGLPKIEADSGPIRAVAGEGAEQRPGKRSVNRETALMFPIVER